MATMYITPTGSGKMDGSSWDNAAKIHQLSKMVEKAGEGGTVLVRADMGAYKLNNPVVVSAGGEPGKEVTIKGVDGQGRDMKAEIIGTRMAEFTPDGNPGNDAIRLVKGADHLNIENFAFKNVGNAIRVADDVKDLHVKDMTADNVRRFFENYHNNREKDATISGLVIENVEVNGFSKGAIRLQYDSHDIVIKNVVGDSERQDGDNFAMGVHLSGTVHDVLIKNSEMKNSHDSTNRYWNGDGFAAETGVYRVRFEDVKASGNTDAGFDLKSKDTVLIRCVAEDNNRNFRFWGDGITLIDSQSLDPQHRGGIGGQAHIYLAKNADVMIINTKISDNSSRTTVFDLSDGRATLLLDEVDITVNAAARLARLLDGSRLQNIDGSKVVADVFKLGDAVSVTASNGAPPPSTVSVSADAGSVTEGHSGVTPVTFTVSRTGDLTKAGSVAFQVVGSGADAAEAADFQGGVFPSGHVHFAAGEMTKNITINVVGERAIEGNEGFTLRLQQPSDSTIKTGTASVTIVNDDLGPVGLTAIGRAGAVDLSASTNQTVTGPSHHNTFFVDIAARSGRDTIQNFGSDDILVTTRAIRDGNGDGLIQFGADRILELDVNGDRIGFSNPQIDDLRYLGATSQGLHVYADADVRPNRAIEGTVGNDRMGGDRGDARSNAFFFDTALDINLGADTVGNFGARDILVTTTKLEDVGGRVVMGANGLLQLPGGEGGALDGYFAGEGGSVRLAGVTGQPVALEYDGVRVKDGVSYFVYSLAGSAAGVNDLSL
jgi:hypothetical protein